MKKIIFLSSLVLAVAIFSGYKTSSSKTDPKAAKSKVTTAADEFKRKSAEAKPRILYLISSDKKVNPSLWWKSDYNGTLQAGC